MRTRQPWRGVRMRRTRASADPESPARLVTLPASWDDGAAAGLAALLPGSGPVRLADAAECCIGPLAHRASAKGLDVPLGERLHLLLLARRGAPDAALWSSSDNGSAGFVLNLAAFFDPALGFLAGAFAEAVETAAYALMLAPSAGGRPTLRVADLAGLIAVLGLDYDSVAARSLGGEIAALLRGHIDQACASGVGVRVAAVIAPPGPAEALLGVESGGIAPAFSFVRPEGGLTRAARAWLAARHISAEAALAQTLAGSPPIPEVSAAAYAAMREHMLPFFDAASPERELAPTLRFATIRETPPSPTRGYTQKAFLAGHKLYVRTGEYADGRLAEIAIAATRQGPMVRGLLEAVGAAVSVGLQHGVPLGEFAEAFLATEAGASLAVEGDPRVSRAASLLDYVFRNLAANYLPTADQPPAISVEPDAPSEREPAPPQADPPLLPLGLPLAPPPRERRRFLRLVAK